MSVSGLEWQEGPQRNRTRFRCHCHIGTEVFDFMMTLLGEVRKKNDGRWEWFRRPTAYAPPGWNVTKHQQGVVATKEDAMREVEKGFNNQ